MSKKPHIRSCPEHSLLNFNWNFMKLADTLDKHKISEEFEFRPDRIINYWVTCACAENPIFDLVRTIACLVLTGSLWKLLTGITSRMSSTIHFRKTCPWVQKYIKLCPEHSLCNFHSIFVKLANKLNRCEIFDKLETAPHFLWSYIPLIAGMLRLWWAIVAHWTTCVCFFS